MKMVNQLNSNRQQREAQVQLEQFGNEQMIAEVDLDGQIEEVDEL